jgi:hypothetical protein
MLLRISLLMQILFVGRIISFFKSAVFPTFKSDMYFERGVDVATDCHEQSLQCSSKVLVNCLIRLI